MPVTIAAFVDRSFVEGFPEGVVVATVVPSRQPSWLIVLGRRLALS